MNRPTKTINSSTPSSSGDGGYDEKKQNAIENLLLHSEKLILVMQAAYVEMCNTGTDNAMLWIENTLDEKGLIPDVRKRTSAQEFFDEELAKLESRRRNEGERPFTLPFYR